MNDKERGFIHKERGFIHDVVDYHVVSNCCFAPTYNPGGDDFGICMQCKEYCGLEKHEEIYE